MRIIHTADLHLGMRPEKQSSFGELREKELWATFRRLIDECNRVEADLLLIAGDLFHRQPLVRELREVNYEFSRLKATKVCLIAGNHDFLGARSRMLDFGWSDNVIFFKNAEPEKHRLPELNTVITGFSYPTRDVTERLVDGLRGETGCISILLAHGGDGRDVPMDLRLLSIAGFTYVALGHIHKPQLFSQSMAYAGSLEPLDKNETGDHGYVLVDIAQLEGGSYQAKASFVPFACRSYVELPLGLTAVDTNGSIAARLSEAMEEHGMHNLFRVRLSGTYDASLVLDLQQLYSLGYVVEIENEAQPAFDLDALYEANKDNLIGMYIERMTGISPADEVSKRALYLGLVALLPK